MISYHHASKLSILILLSEVLKQEFERKIKELRENLFPTHTNWSI